MSYDYANGESPLDSNVAELPAIRLQDFLAYMPDHRYIFRPTRDQWPASSVDARVPWPKGRNGQPMKPSNWLDRNSTVEQMTWIPGEPELIEGRLIDGGGWIDHPGVTCFNLYRPPRPETGDASKAAPWVDHLRSVYPDDSDHLIAWLAHRVQCPGEKINRHGRRPGGREGYGPRAGKAGDRSVEYGGGVAAATDGPVQRFREGRHHAGLGVPGSGRRRPLQVV